MKNGGIGWLRLLFPLLIRSPAIAHADLILVHGWNYTRYEESSGAFIRENFSNSEGLSQPVMGPDGQLYGTGNGVGDGAILRLTETGTTVFVPYKSGGFTQPFGMAFGTNGDIYAGSIVWTNYTLGYGRILQFNGSTGEFIRESIPARSYILPSPTGMAIGPDGWIYVTDSQLGLARFAPVGYARELLATNIVSFPQFGPDGALYVKSSPTLVQRFDQTTKMFVPFIDSASFGITNWIVGVWPGRTVLLRNFFFRRIPSDRTSKQGLSLQSTDRKTSRCVCSRTIRILFIQCQFHSLFRRASFDFDCGSWQISTLSKDSEQLHIGTVQFNRRRRRLGPRSRSVFPNRHGISRDKHFERLRAFLSTPSMRQRHFADT